MKKTSSKQTYIAVDQNSQSQVRIDRTKASLIKWKKKESKENLKQSAKVVAAALKNNHKSSGSSQDVDPVDGTFLLPDG